MTKLYTIGGYDPAVGNCIGPVNVMSRIDGVGTGGKPGLVTGGSSGSAAVWDGSTGAKLFGGNLVAPPGSVSFGQWVGSAGDTNGDGKSEIAVGDGGVRFACAGCSTGARSAGQVSTFDGATGAFIRSMHPNDTWIQFNGTPKGASIASSLVPDQSGAGPAPGERVAVLKYELRDPQPAQGNGFGVTAAAFVDGTGKSTLIVGAERSNGTGAVPGAARYGSASLFDGSNGNVVGLVDTSAFRQPLNACGTGDPQPNVGRSVAAPGDLNGDGKPDFLVAANNYNTQCDAAAGIRDQGVIVTSMSR